MHKKTNLNVSGINLPPPSCELGLSAIEAMRMVERSLERFLNWLVIFIRQIVSKDNDFTKIFEKSVVHHNQETYRIVHFQDNK